MTLNKNYLYMETKRTMVLSFHVCRGGRFFNPGHVEFVGEETFSDVCSMLSDRLFTKDRSMGGSANPILQTKWALSLVRTTRTEEQER